MVEISVIMPVYNTEKYLEESVNYILNQTFKDIELICVNDGSTDNSLNILKELAEKDNRVIIFNQENKGGGAARNYALTKATGKYVYFMDSDDIIELTALEELYKIAEEKNTDFIIFQAHEYNEENKEYYDTEYFSMNKIADFVGEDIFNYKDLDDLIFKMSVTPWSKFFNRKFINDSGAKFAEGLIFHDNVFFWKMFFQAKRVYFYRKYLYSRREHSASSTHSGDKRRVNTIKIRNMITQIFIEFNEFERFKKKLYNEKIRIINVRFSQSQDIYKEFFLEEMKKDFSKIINHEKYEDFIDNLTKRNLLIFESGLNSKTWKEYELKVKNYDLNSKIKKEERENKKLKEKNEKLKEKNEKLKEKNEKLKKERKEILNSRSWKLTKPLRKIKKII